MLPSEKKYKSDCACSENIYWPGVWDPCGESPHALRMALLFFPQLVRMPRPGAWTREVLKCVPAAWRAWHAHISLQLAGWIWDLGLGIRVSAGCFEPLAWARSSAQCRHTLHWGFRAKTKQLSKCLAFFTILSCLYVSFGCLTGWRGGWTYMVFRHSWIIWPREFLSVLCSYLGLIVLCSGGCPEL